MTLEKILDYKKGSPPKKVGKDTVDNFVWKCRQGFSGWTGGSSPTLQTESLACNSTDGEIPELDRLVVAAGDDEEVVEAEASDPIGVRFQCHYPLEGL